MNEVYEDAMDMTLEEIYSKAPNIRKISGEISGGFIEYSFVENKYNPGAFIFFFTDKTDADMESYPKLYPLWAPIIDGFFVSPLGSRFHGRISYHKWSTGIPVTFEEFLLILLTGE